MYDYELWSKEKSLDTQISQTTASIKGAWDYFFLNDLVTIQPLFMGNLVVIYIQMGMMAPIGLSIDTI